MRSAPFGVGLTASLGFGSVLDDDLSFYPSNVPGTLAFFDIMRPSTLVYGSTLKVTGGGPAVTITRQPTISTAFKIEIQTATTFRWSNDGGSTWVASGVTIPNGSTADLGASGEFAFAAGVYSSAHSYEITLQEWLSYNTPVNKWVQATAASQARVVAGPTGTGATVAARSDGVDDQYLMNTLSLPSPGTTPLFYWGIIRWDAYSTNDQLIGSDNARVAVSAGAGANTMRQQCGSSANETAITIGSFGRFQAYFSSSASDSFKWKATNTNTGNAGGTAPLNSNLYLFARNGVATTWMQASLHCLLICNNYPTANIANLDTWAADRGGAGLLA